MAYNNSVLRMSARDLSRELSEGRLTAEELMVETLERIESVNPKVNAIICVRDREELLEEARRCDRDRSQKSNCVGVLHGIPTAVKDLSNVAGLPTTMGGSPLHRFRNIPSESDPFVRRIIKEGAIVIGKTNTPELGVGSHTFNKRWGTTLNPYDRTKSAGGSSGGAAVAVATRMLSFCDGTDMMGSLRNPAGWNNIYSHRPTAGMINGDDNGQVPNANPLPYPISTAGPMARCPQDLAFLLQVMAGSGKFDATRVGDNIPSVESIRIGWLGDWDGNIPVEDGILPLCQEALTVFSKNGMTVDDLSSQPIFDLKVLWNSWTTIRAKIISSNFSGAPKALLKAFLWVAPIREELKWELRKGLDTSEAFCLRAAEEAKRCPSASMKPSCSMMCWQCQPPKPGRSPRSGDGHKE
ncbi:Glutamyl-tRNA(Gln) amidotransferase subunit A [Seminavis robusta]|uniref:Glutamyl-tRNA(Gln) amidotransferase subunit A n=1 Tax=Seminavis robusta TaxID=568900 RepID=A0A9N8HV39_9STRA|nr:Glutamyl-tRNA(Gln) amidotransferase subunit A [Seminavis robusta]|eukprot:Sro2231_g320030.1 Glutamyl-tRNA(Gln) amidotransferase subunit A (411) ;mRNA; f:1915-3147